jgi:hypothetical protein
VWEAIATGPGITSWFVPHQVEERQGGIVRMDFGPGFGEAPSLLGRREPRPHTSAEPGSQLTTAVPAHEGPQIVGEPFAAWRKACVLLTQLGHERMPSSQALAGTARSRSGGAWPKFDCAVNDG